MNTHTHTHTHIYKCITSVVMFCVGASPPHHSTARPFFLERMERLRSHRYRYCVAVCCSVLQCVAACCTAMYGTSSISLLWHFIST